MSGHAASRRFGIELYPFPLLLLPLYAGDSLVYGILRYELMIVNAWARRGLAWALTVGLGSGAPDRAQRAAAALRRRRVSGWSLWAVAVATLLASGLLLDPSAALATRLEYTGLAPRRGRHRALARTPAAGGTHEALAQRPRAILSAQLRIGIAANGEP